MKVKNKNFVMPNQPEQAQVGTYMNGLVDTVESVSFDDIRANVPSVASFEDGAIHQLLANLNFEVSRD